MACFMMDASGHGVHSALVSVSVSQLLQPGSTTLPLDSPAAVCEELDRQFPLERFNTFFSMIYIVLDLKARTLRWCNAGHPPGALRRSGGEVELLDATGPNGLASDGGHLVQYAFWYILQDDGDYQTGNLYDRGLNILTPLGEAFKQYVADRE